MKGKELSPRGLLTAVFTATTFAAGLAPAVVWMAFFWWWDRHDREPLRLIALLFLVGALPVAIAAGLVNSAFVAAGMPLLVVAVLIAPVIEESLKYLGTRTVALRSSAFDEPVDGMVYGTAVGLGFAAAENIDYLLSATLELTGRVDLIPECVGLSAEQCSLLLVLPGRAFGTTLLHGLAAGLAGYTLSRRRFGASTNLPYPRLRGLGFAILLHAGWNLATGFGLGALVTVLAVGIVRYSLVFRAALRVSPHAVARLR